jgi:hypothetical protein
VSEWAVVTRATGRLAHERLVDARVVQNFFAGVSEAAVLTIVAVDRDLALAVGTCPDDNILAKLRLVVVLLRGAPPPQHVVGILASERFEWYIC